MLCQCDCCRYHYTEDCSKEACEEQSLYLNEIMELAEYLEKYQSDYFYEIRHLHDGYQIKVYDPKGHYVWDAVCHYYSYGHEEGLLEIMGDIVNHDDDWEVEGYLTAKDIIERLEKSAD